MNHFGRSRNTNAVERASIPCAEALRRRSWHQRASAENDTNYCHFVAFQLKLRHSLLQYDVMRVPAEKNTNYLNFGALQLKRRRVLSLYVVPCVPANEQNYYETSREIAAATR